MHDKKGSRREHQMYFETYIIREELIDTHLGRFKLTYHKEKCGTRLLVEAKQVSAQMDNKIYTLRPDGLPNHFYMIDPKEFMAPFVAECDMLAYSVERSDDVKEIVIYPLRYNLVQDNYNMIGFMRKLPRLNREFYETIRHSKLNLKR